MISGFVVSERAPYYRCALYQHGPQITEYERFVTNFGRDHLMSSLFNCLTRDLLTSDFLGDVYNLTLDLTYVDASNKTCTHSMSILTLSFEACKAAPIELQQINRIQADLDSKSVTFGILLHNRSRWPALILFYLIYRGTLCTANCVRQI
jgi:hypothetical protein